MFDQERSAVVKADFPEHDILNLRFDDNRFDYALSDQVIEHIEGNPQQAIDESLRVVRPGGWIVHTTCFMNPIHLVPSDLWRYAPDALEYLCRGASRIVDVGGWGNPLVPPLLALGIRWVGVPHASWHPLHKVATWNRPGWPMTVWIVAEK